MATVITIKIEKLPPMKNALRGRHWSAGYAAKKEWSWLLMGAVSLGDRDILRSWSTLRYCVQVEMALETKNLYDEDNLSSAGNVVLDALKWCRFIADDDPEHLKFITPTQVKAKRGSLTIQIQRCL